MRCPHNPGLQCNSSDKCIGGDVCCADCTVQCDNPCYEWRDNALPIIIDLEFEIKGEWDGGG